METTRALLRAIIVIDENAIISFTGDWIPGRDSRSGKKVLGMPIQELFLDQEYDGMISAIGLVLSGATDELHGMAHSGKQSLSWTATALRKANNLRGAALFMSPDPTVGRELQFSVESYRETFLNAIEGIFRSTLDGHYLEANASLAQIYGFKSPEDLIAAFRDLNTQLYVNPERRADFVQLMQKQGYVSDFESEVFRADGSRIWITEFARTVPDRNGRPAYFEGSVVEVSKRHSDAAALRESELKFRSLVESLNVVPWEANRETGEVVYVGPQAVSMFGYPVKDWFDPDFWSTHIHEEDREWVTIAKGEAFAKAERFELEYRFLRNDGEVVWVRDLMSIIRSEDQSHLIGGFLVDVTYHHFTETSSRESHFFLDHLASATPAIVYLYGLMSGQCLYVNGQAQEILGYSKLALSQMSPLFIEALGHPDEIDEQRQHRERLFSSGSGDRVLERDIRLRRSDGDWIWLRCRESVYKRSQSGKPLQVVGVATDITLRRFALEELVANEHLFRNLVETTRVVPFEFSIKAERITYVGPQAELLFGYPIKRWYTEGFAVSIVHPEDQANAPRPFGRRSADTEGAKDLQAEFRIRTEGGTYMWVRNIVRIAAEEMGQGSGRGFLVDVTETKDREAQLDDSRNQLRELVLRSQNIREEERIRIARELHDELGQAMTLSQMDLEWIEASASKAENWSEQSRTIRRIAALKSRMKVTIESLRRIYTNLRPPILDELGLGAAIDWQAEEFSRHVGIRCDVSLCDLETLDGEVATAVFRIFQEILTNIAKHAAATSVKVTLRIAGERLTMSVADNGKGFSVPANGRLGRGFGLLGMRERTAALQGQLEIVSTPAGGTLISVELPLVAVSS